MKKQKKQLIGIVILLIICVGAYIGVTIYNNQQQKASAAEEEASTVHVTELDSDEVNTFSYDYNNETLTFVKENDVWYYEGDKTINIDQDAIATMLDTVTAMTAEEEVTGYDSLDDYGVETPAMTLTVTTADGTITLQFGDENTMLSEYYLLKDDTLYLVASSNFTAFQKSVDDLTAVEDTETETPSEG